MPSAAKWWTFGDAKGLNQRAQPLLGGEGGVLLESENLSFFQQGGIVQRFGSAAQSLTSSGFTGIVEWGGRNTTVGGVEELWAAANNAGTAALGRRVGGVWGPITFSDTANPVNLRYMQAASLTSKYFILYDSDVNRLHVWDGTTLRRAGLAMSGPPSVAAMGVGSLSATRFYRQRYVEMSGTTIVRRSEASTSVELAIASKAGWQVTKGAALSEGETHWEIEAADAEIGPWWRIARQAITTTAYEDTSVTIDDTDLSPLAGEYIPAPSAKYILSDTNRILLAGAWETTSDDDQTEIKQNRVWFTDVLGATDEGDDERIPNTVDQQNWVDVGNEGPITAIAGPLYGDIYVFKADSIFKLTPTGDFVTPYRVIQLVGGIGAVDQRCVCVGVMGTGTPAIFFASTSAVYAITSGGVVEISDDVSRDLRMTNFTPAFSWLAYNPYDKGLQAQTNSGMSVTAGQYYQFSYDLKAQRWSGITIGGSGAYWVLGRSILGTNTILGGGGAEVRNAVVAQNDNGSLRLLLVGQNNSAASQILACGDVCGVDGSTAFTSRFRVRKFPTPGHHFIVGAPTLVYRNPVGDSGVTGSLTVEYLNQKGTAAISGPRLLKATVQDDPLDQEVITLDGLDHGDKLAVLDVRITLIYSGSFATSIPPSIDAFMIPVTEKDGYAQ
jgi:hypothetical protein